MHCSQTLCVAFNIHLLICAIFAVLIPVTDPLLHQTLLALGAAVFGGTGWCVGAALLIRAVPAVWVTIATHCGQHTLATGTLKICGTAAFIYYTERGVGGGIEHKGVIYKQTWLIQSVDIPYLVQWLHTTVFLIAAVPAVSLPVTEEAVWNAAAFVITLVSAALHLLGTSHFVRAVLTLRHTVTHLALLYALLSMGTLELVCRGHVVGVIIGLQTVSVFSALMDSAVLHKYFCKHSPTTWARLHSYRYAICLCSLAMNDWYINILLYSDNTVQCNFRLLHVSIKPLQHQEASCTLNVNRRKVLMR